MRYWKYQEYPKAKPQYLTTAELLAKKLRIEWQGLRVEFGVIN